MNAPLDAASAVKLPNQRAVLLETTSKDERETGLITQDQRHTLYFTLEIIKRSS